MVRLSRANVTKTVIPAKSSVASSALPLKPQVTTTKAVTQPLLLLPSHATFDERQRPLPALSKPKLVQAGEAPPLPVVGATVAPRHVLPLNLTAFTPKYNTVRPFF